MAALNTFRTDGEDFGEQILSKVVKAGRRTYFLDVRATRANDYFLLSSTYKCNFLGADNKQ